MMLQRQGCGKVLSSDSCCQQNCICVKNRIHFVKSGVHAQLFGASNLLLFKVCVLENLVVVLCVSDRKL